MLDATLEGQGSWLMASKTGARSKQAQRQVELMPLLLIAALGAFATAMWLWRGQELALPRLTVVPAGAAAAADVPNEPPPMPFSVPQLPARALDKSWRVVDGKAVVVRPDQSFLSLTLDARKQRSIEKLLRKNRNAHAQVVIIDAQSGAVVVMAQHTERGDPAGARHALASARQPAASVFKIVTTAALLEAGVKPSDTTCFHGGVRGIKRWHLKDRPTFDKRCETLTQALANSSNVVFARRALKHLQPGALAAKASDFLFGTELRFDVMGRASTFTEGTGKLRRARAAAGFVGASMSAVHGAVIGAALANKGVAMRPYVVEADSLQPGEKASPTELGAIVDADHASTLLDMLSTTATSGTARRAFKKWPARLAHIGVAAKTGSLNGRGKPWRHYSWFVGAAPVDKPEIGFAVLAVNGPKGRAKAAALARDALALWFADRQISDEDIEPKP